MFQITQFRMDEPLTLEQAKSIDDRIAIAARQVMVGRKLANVRGPLGLGVQIFSYDKLTEMSDAGIDMVFKAMGAVDDIALGRTDLPVPIVHKEFNIDRRDLESSRRMGTPLDTSSAEAAAYKAAIAEDKLLILGWAPDGSTYRINGFYNGAANSEAGADFTTPTNIPISVNVAIGDLLADNIYPPYNMVLHPTQYAETLPLIGSTGTSYRQWILDSLGGGSLFVTPAITVGTGLIMQAAPSPFAEIELGQDLVTEMEMKPLALGGDLFGRVYETLVPVLRDPNVACKLTSI
jgi:uncharacterized linocin/CFP29 family protein